MPVAAGISAAGSAASGVLGFLGSQSAAKSQKNAIAAMNALFAQAKGEVQPFISAGQTAAGTLSNLLTPGPNQTATLSQLPGFQFAQDWGQKAVRNQGTTMGLGGNVLTSAANYATGLAQQNFGNYANLLQNLTNTGAGAANTLLGSSVGQGANLAGAYTGLGAAQASGFNALGAGIGGVANAASNAIILPQYFNALSQRTQQSANPALGVGIYGTAANTPYPYGP